MMGSGMPFFWKFNQNVISTTNCWTKQTCKFVYHLILFISIYMGQWQVNVNFGWNMRLVANGSNNKGKGEYWALFLRLSKHFLILSLSLHQLSVKYMTKREKISKLSLGSPSPPSSSLSRAFKRYEAASSHQRHFPFCPPERRRNPVFNVQIS